MPELKQHPVVFRLKAIWPGELGRVEMHRKRTGGDLSHVNRARSHLNTFLVGDEDWKEELLADIETSKVQNLANRVAALESKKRKKQAREVAAAGPQDPWQTTRGHGPLREGILTANREFFAGDLPGFEDQEKVAAFEERALKFLDEQFGDALVAAWKDLDEEGYHIHFAVAKWVEKTTGKGGKQRTLVPSAVPVVKSYEDGQDIVASYFSDIGLTRGKKRAQERRDALAEEKKVDPKRENTPCHTWRAEQAVELQKTRRAAEKAAATAYLALTENRNASKEADIAWLRAVNAETDAENQAAVLDEKMDMLDHRESLLDEREGELEEREEAIQAEDSRLSRWRSQLEQKERNIRDAVRGLIELGDKVQAAARKLGMLAEPVVKAGIDAAQKLGNWQRQR